MKNFFAFVLSCLIMGIIFLRVDFSQFRFYVSQMSLPLFLLAISFFVPQVALSAYRWKVMMKRKSEISFLESSRLILAASALNILLPSRAGDFSKAYFVAREKRVDLSRAMNLVFFEKYIDLASLGVVILTGVAGSRRWDGPSVAGTLFALGALGLFPLICLIDFQRLAGHSVLTRHALGIKLGSFLRDSHDYLSEMRKAPGYLSFLILISIFLWFLHLLQFYVLFQAFHSNVSVYQIFRLVPLAILTGLLPVTLAGIGTRDSALIYLFAPYEKTALIVGIGLFASLRYFVPGILGLPFLNHTIVKKVEK